MTSTLIIVLIKRDMSSHYLVLGSSDLHIVQGTEAQEVSKAGWESRVPCSFQLALGRGDGSYERVELCSSLEKKNGHYQDNLKFLLDKYQHFWAGN